MSYILFGKIIFFCLSVMPDEVVDIHSDYINEEIALNSYAECDIQDDEEGLFVPESEQVDSYFFEDDDELEEHLRTLQLEGSDPAPVKKKKKNERNHWLNVTGVLTHAILLVPTLNTKPPMPCQVKQCFKLI